MLPDLQKDSKKANLKVDKGFIPTHFWADAMTARYPLFIGYCLQCMEGKQQPGRKDCEHANQRKIGIHAKAC